MGHIMAELIKLGLQNVGYELVTDVVTFRKNGARKVHEVTGNDFAREYIQENASFASIELVNHFRGNGRTLASAHKAIRNLLQEGAIKKLSAANYQRADVKALPAPKGKRSATHVGPRHEIGNKEVILKRIKGRAKFTMKELRDHFSNIRRNPHSVSPIIAKLGQAGIVTVIEPGVYAWGKKKKIAKKKQVRKKRSVPAASPQLEQTNG